MKKAKFLEAINLILILWFVFWTFSWLFIGAYYCNPNAEDLSLSVVPRDEGFLKSIVELLISYDGRYFTNVLHGINPLVFNSLAGYKFMPLVGILLFVSSFTFLLNNFFTESTKGAILLFSLIFTATHFALAPSLPHDLYWMVSSFVYLYPWSFTFLWVGSFMRYIVANAKSTRLFWFFATTFFLICCVGINEMFHVTNVVLFSVILVLSLRRRNELLVKNLPILIIGFSCMAFFLSCPGIRERMASNRVSGNSLFYLPGMFQGLSDYKFTAIELLKNGLPIILFLLFALNANLVRIKNKWLEQKNTFNNLLLLALSTMIIGYAMTLAYYLPMQTTINYPARIFNSIITIFLLILFVLLPLSIKQIYDSRILAVILKYKVILNFSLCIMLLFVLKISNNNIHKLCTEFNAGILQNYDEQMKLRYAIINKVKANSSLYKIAEVPQIVNAPRTNYYGPDIIANRESSYWNQGYEMYFGIDEIWLDGDSLSYKESHQ